MLLYFEFFVAYSVVLADTIGMLNIKTLSNYRSRSRSRSNSFSPPPVDENGAADEPTIEEPSSPVEKTPEEKIDLPPYYPALQVRI